MMNMKSLIVTLVAVVCLTSCVITGAPKITPVETSTITFGEVPLDAAIVTSAMVDLIWGINPESALVTFDENGTNILSMGNLNWGPFHVDSVIYGSGQQLEANENRMLLSATLRFADEWTRTVGAGYLAEYGIENEQRVRIFHSDIYPVYSKSPRTEAYFVPLAVLQKAGKEIYSKWSSLYDLVKSSAIPLGMGASVNKTPVEYSCVVFCMDRMSPDTEFKVVASETSFGMESKAKVLVSDYEGFRVAIFSGKFALGDVNQKLYVNVFYTTVGQDDESTAVSYKIGQFTNQNR